MQRSKRPTPFWIGFLSGGVAAAVLASTLAWGAVTTLYAHDVATVDGVTISESQMLWYLLSQGGKDTVRDLVTTAIVSGQAKTFNITVDPAKVDAVLTEIYGDKVTEVAKGVNLDEVKVALTRELAARGVYEAKEKELSADPKYAVTDDEVIDAYAHNPDQMIIPEQVKLSLINTKNLKSADAAMAELKAGKAFAEVATKYSEDEVTRANGGKIDQALPRGYFRGPLKKLEDIAFKLNIGEHSEVITAADEYFIVQVDAKIPGRERSFDEVKGQIRDSLQLKKISAPMRDWLQSLGTKAVVKVTYPILEGFSPQDLARMEIPKEPGAESAPKSGGTTPAP